MSGAEESREEAMREMNDLATANSIPWPPNADMGEDQVIESTNRITQAIYSREIERLLE